MNAIIEAKQGTKLESVERWYAGATVRNSPRIVVPDESMGEDLFPRSRQVLSEHPLVKARGPQAVSYVLAQSAYKYMYEIGLLETRFVIDCALNIVNNKIQGANEEEKLEALTIVIDEGYHAHVALDFIIQMKSLTAIEPIEVPQTNGNLDAVRRAYAALPEHMHRDFELLSVTLAEHTLTKDLLAIGREKGATRTFTQVMTDHVSDEGRHANYFARMLKARWVALPEETKEAFGKMLPDYLDDYLAGDEERAFDKRVLAQCGLDDSQVAMAIADTNAEYLEKQDGYITKTKANLVKLLQRCGILDHAPTRAVFIDRKLI